MMMPLFRRLVRYLEDPQRPFMNTALAFAAAVVLRNILEQVVFESSDPEYYLIDFYHYDVSYCYLALGLILIFHWAARVRVATAARAVLPSFFILLLVPLIDGILMLFTGEYTLNYLFPDRHGSFWGRFFTFFGRFDGAGVTPGGRVEIALALLGAWLYFTVKGASVLRRIVFVVMAYMLLFSYCAFPYVFTFFFETLHLPYQLDAMVLTKFYVMGITVLGSMMVWRGGPTVLQAMIRSSAGRLLCDVLIFAGGVVAGYVIYRGVRPAFSADDLLDGWVSLATLILAGLLGLIADQVIPKGAIPASASNNDRLAGRDVRALWTVLATGFVVAVSAHVVNALFYVGLVMILLLRKRPSAAPRGRVVPVLSRIGQALVVLCWGGAYGLDWFRGFSGF